jgi:hypothetical protein
VQTKQHFTNAFTVLPELLAALQKVSPQFLGIYWARACIPPIDEPRTTIKASNP